MKSLKGSFWKGGVTTLICSVFLFAGVASALDIVLEPENAQREVGGKVRVHIYADNAVDLISMGVQVSFDEDILQVESAYKCEEDADTGWVMDADGDPATTDDQYRTPAVEIDNTNGVVTMVGGNIKGESTTGHSGKVLLGWIVFEAIANGNSNLEVDLGRYNPNPGETYDNFVRLDKAVDEPTNVPGDLGIICVVDNACYADQDGDGDVDAVDKLKHRLAAPSTFPSAKYKPAADIDADGDVDAVDKLKFRLGSPRSDCPDCP